MSDSSPLLMEMSSQVSGYGSAAPLQQGQTAGGPEFSGVLQTVLQKGLQKPHMTELAQEQMLQAELLAQTLAAADTEGSITTLTQQTTTEILPLPGGNSLPFSEQADPSFGLFAMQGMSDADGLGTSSTEAELIPDMLNAPVDKNIKTVPQTAFTTQEQNQVRREQQGLLDDMVMQEKLDKEILTDLDKAAARTPIPTLVENPVLQQTAKSLNNNSERSTLNPLEELRVARSELDIDKGEVPAADTLVKQPSFEAALQRSNGTGLNADNLSAQDGVDANTALTSAGSNTTTESTAARVNAGTGLNGALSGVTAYAAISNTGPNTTIQHVGPTIATLTIPPENPAWSSFVGDRVQWMVGQDIQQAHIKLNPPELGALEINVQVGQDKQTTISFSSPHAQVRDALESATPRLREMFGDNGLSLGDVNISHQSMSQQQQSRREELAENTLQNKAADLSNDEASVVSPSSSISQGNGMLDLYA